MLRSLLLSGAAVALGLLATTRATAAHQHLHHAVYELRLAHEELDKAGHNFGGNKDKALLAIDASYRQIERCLEAVGEPYSAKFSPPAGIYKGYKNHQHLRHALVELREARTYLKDANNNFGGHKKKAIDDIDVAIIHVEKCIEHIR